MNNTPKALFFCGSTQHITNYNLILKELVDWDAVFYWADIGNSEDMIDLFSELKLKNKNIPKVNNKCILRILKKEEPSIVITFHDQTPTTILYIKNSNSLSIPSLMVQDGLYDLEFNKDDRLKIRTYNRAKFMLNLPSQLILFLINNNSLKYKLKTIYFELRYGKKGKRTVHGQGESTKIAVFGESTKDFLVSLGVNPKKIEITGSPKFDSLYLINNNKSIKKDNNKIILVITQPLVENGMWTSDQRAVFIKSILESTKNINNVDLILKLHHHENKKDYEKILKNLYKNVKIYDNYPLHELIHSSDIAITLYSTAGLEAMILKKPLIILNLFKNNLPTVFKGMNVININNKEDIENTIKTYLYDSDKINKLIESYKDLYYHTYKIDGKSAIRIANLINEMVN